MADVPLHTQSQTDPSAEPLLAASDVSAITSASVAVTGQNSTQTDADNLQRKPVPVVERDRFLIVLGWLFFVVMSTQYLIVAFDRPDPLLWRRGPAFQLYRVDVNTGTWVEWMQLEGIGQTMAHRIVANREELGPFLTIDDLTRVNGIGPVTLDRLRPRLTISHGDDE
jgi:competence ComEA-like helix-hairpin-helix protein